MIKQVFFYETRDLAFLPHIQAVYSKVGIETKVLTERDLNGSKQWRDFQENYDHRSTNPKSFELACFARYFALYEHLASINTLEDQVVILSDSDTVPQLNADGIIKTFVGKNVFVASQNFYNESRLEPQYSPHFSMWSPSLLSDFLGFLLTFYSTKTENELAKMQQRYAVLGMNESISDMTLLYEWVKNRGYKFFNFSDLTLAQFSDHNLSCLRRSIGGEARVVLPVYSPIKGKIGFVSLRDFKFYWPIVLHVQGGKKRLIPLYFRYRFLFFIFLIAWLLAEKLKVTGVFRRKT